ncbi:uncharacterized protein F5147DRAFT_654902 [Suillus discolor]|uniref:Uncharacterized protein n=1 Tax=Suillus discolor TaxID=1912936 RepID=A0A9P7F189_9AGAM|nr:uncharacterized protein F5147DRAFT_654902 [Suillus discolor]KAG2102819.1 hypothetical protein F5147DRAFT_654902 [Suillus discolor]
MHTKRFEPYHRPSKHIRASENSSTAPLAKTMAVYFDESEAPHLSIVGNDVWMGSAMCIDSPNNHSTAGMSECQCALNMNVGTADEVPTLAVMLPADISMIGVTDDVTKNRATKDQSSSKRKVTQHLHKTVQNCIKCHCKIGHPTTDYLRMCIDTALQAALESVDIEDIMLGCDLKAANLMKKNAEGKQDSLITTDHAPAVTHIFNSVKCRLLCLGTASNPTSEASGMMYRAGPPGSMRVSIIQNVEPHKHGIFKQIVYSKCKEEQAKSVPHPWAILEEGTCVVNLHTSPLPIMNHGTVAIAVVQHCSE